MSILTQFDLLARTAAFSNDNLASLNELPSKAKEAYRANDSRLLRQELSNSVNFCDSNKVSVDGKSVFADATSNITACNVDTVRVVGFPDTNYVNFPDETHVVN